MGSHLYLLLGFLPRRRTRMMTAAMYPFLNPRFLLLLRLLSQN
ncbi:putative MAPK-interacting and spindle-stabilizing protein-like [Iris pallida]|uniref:MAPK-interacting and spindle-stabilizing protein-like n=1 Tax=Iris pallida TaxID=29817 RepID=A0AAX6IL74_IRIPA|nr:putative MAPK-interacting and spindle-stabilizing protein-like [Iris pallida]